MGQAPVADLSLRRAADLTSPTPAAHGRWNLAALRGRLVELVGGAGSASVTLAVRLIVEAQRVGDFAAWVATHRDIFFPPDLAAAGVDLAALPVVRAGTRGSSRLADEAARAAERLVRSGAFGLVVIDLARELDLSQVSQGRLLRLAERNDAQILILRRRRREGTYSGSLVTVRAESSCEQISPGRFRATVRSIKDKREGPGWTTSEEFDGPPGLY
jgi:recombination protein RecA